MGWAGGCGLRRDPLTLSWGHLRECPLVALRRGSLRARNFECSSAHRSWQIGPVGFAPSPSFIYRPKAEQPAHVSSVPDPSQTCSRRAVALGTGVTRRCLPPPAPSQLTPMACLPNSSPSPGSGPSALGFLTLSLPTNPAPLSFSAVVSHGAICIPYTPLFCPSARFRPAAFGLLALLCFETLFIYLPPLMDRAVTYEDLAEISSPPLINTYPICLPRREQAKQLRPDRIP